MRKIYYTIARLIGYVILLHHHYNSSFEIEKKYAYLSLNKYIGRYKYDNSLKMIRIWEIKIR